MGGRSPDTLSHLLLPSWAREQDSGLEPVIDIWTNTLLWIAIIASHDWLHCANNDGPSLSLFLLSPWVKWKSMLILGIFSMQMNHASNKHELCSFYLQLLAHILYCVFCQSRDYILGCTVIPCNCKFQCSYKFLPLHSILTQKSQENLVYYSEWFVILCPILHFILVNLMWESWVLQRCTFLSHITYICRMHSL